MINADYVADVTITNSTVSITNADADNLMAYGVSISGYTGKVTMSDCTVSVEGAGGGMRALSMAQEGDQTEGFSDAAEITDCEFTVESTSESTSATCEAVRCQSDGKAEFTYNNCSFTAQAEGNSKSNAFDLDSVISLNTHELDRAVLTGCTAAANSNTLAYALSIRGHLTMNEGSAAASGDQDQESAGIKCWDTGCDSGEILLTDADIAGMKYGIYHNGKDNIKVSARNCTISSTNTEFGYGVYLYSSADSLYLGGSTLINGALGGIFKTVTGSVPYPAIYAYSLDETPLSVEDGKSISVYYDNSRANAGEVMINGGMTESLVDKLIISYPDDFSIDKDGKLKTPIKSSVTVTYDYKKGKASAYKDAQYSIYLQKDKVFEGDTVYIKAFPEEGFAFANWEVKAGGVTIANPAAAETSFVMGSSAVTLWAEFEEPKPVITVKYGNYPAEGHSASDVAFSDKKVPHTDYDFTGKGIDEAFGYPTTGTAASSWYYTEQSGVRYRLVGLSENADGSTCDYSWVSGDTNTKYTVDGDITLYPAWERMYRVSCLPGNYAAETDTPPEDRFGGMGTFVTLPGATYTRTDYEQTGWSLTDGGEKAYVLGAKAKVSGDLSLYPFWSRVYTLTYEAGTIPGSGEIRKTSAETSYRVRFGQGEGVTLADSLFSYEPAEGETPKTQIGWAIAADSGNPDYDFGEATVFQDSATLYPVWITDGLRVVFENADDSRYVGDTEQKVYQYDYTGSAIKPVIRVYDGGVLLKEKKDYTLIVKNMTNVNTTAYTLAADGKLVTDEESGVTPEQLKKLPFVTVKGKGNYKETQTFYLSVAPCQMTQEDFTATDEASFAHTVKNGKTTVYKPVPVVSGIVNGKTKKLTNNKDYKITYYAADMDGDEWKTDENGYYRYTGEPLSGLDEAGCYVIRIDGLYDAEKGTGSYSGHLTVRAEVTDKKLIEKAKITCQKIMKAPYGYRGEPLVPESLTVKIGSTTLRRDTDYTVECTNNTKTGTATLTVTGIGDYAGKKSATYKITGYKLNKMKAEGFVASFAYDGTEKVQEDFTFTNGGSGAQKYVLEKDADYTVEYRDNLLPGTATVIYEGKNAFAGSSVKKTFKITGIPMNRVKIHNFPTAALTYNGTAQTIETSDTAEEGKVYFTYQESSAALVTDVPVLTEEEYNSHNDGVFIRYITDPSKKGNNINVGNMSVEMVGSGIYSGSVKKSVKITAYDLNADPDLLVSVIYEAEQKYRKGSVKPEVTVKFTNAANETVELNTKSVAAVYKNNTKLNDGSVPSKAPRIELKGKGNFKGTRKVYFSIGKGVLQDVMVKAADKAVVLKPDNYTTALTVTDLNGKALKAGTDYDKKSIAYFYGEDVTVTNAGAEVNRTEGDPVTPGDIVPAAPTGRKMIVTVTGKGNYEGTAKAEFYIRSGSIKGAKVEFKKNYYYDKGNAIIPQKDEIILRIKTGKTGKNAVWTEVDPDDYRIVEESFKNNRKPGKASFVIEGQNGRAGQITAKFTILPRFLAHYFQ
ncbi:MAG: hypothetical protein K6F53_11030 [Lachnospiraceae bacterium]|nr:hypothetical protein [Lachnospiraceae bacterium]